MEELLNNLIILLTQHGLPAGVGLGIGLIIPFAIPILRRYVKATPSKADDLIVDTIEALIKRNGPLATMTAKELERALPTSIINELVRLRKARIEAERK